MKKVLEYADLVNAGYDNKKYRGETRSNLGEIYECAIKYWSEYVANFEDQIHTKQTLEAGSPFQYDSVVGMKEYAEEVVKNVELNREQDMGYGMTK